MSSETTSQFVLGWMTRGLRGLQHPGKALKGKNAGMQHENRSQLLKQGEECCFSPCQCFFLLISEITIEDFQWLFGKRANDFISPAKGREPKLSKTVMYTPKHSDVRRRPNKSSVIIHWPCMCEAPGVIPTTAQQKRNKEEKAHAFHNTSPLSVL